MVTAPYVITVVTETCTGGSLSAIYDVPSGTQMGTYLYAEVGGAGQTVTVLDDYHDPDGRFVMSCVAVRRDDLPVYAIFRKTNGWSCVIFEACDAFATADQSVMPASGELTTVTFFDGDVEVGEAQLWGQWTLGRWRWQSGPWPYPKNVEQLRAKGWLPLMNSLALGQEPAKPNRLADPYLPMHIPGEWPLYVGGGGNPTLFSSRQGYWLCHPEDPAAFAGMIAEAEGLAAYPWFVRDTATWSVPDIWNAYPTRNTWCPSAAYSLFNVDVYGEPGTVFGYDPVTDDRGQQWTFQWQPYCVIAADGYCAATLQNQGYPGASEPTGQLTLGTAGIDSISRKDPSGFVQGSGLVIDEAHSGSQWAAPWIATGDPYYLEALHAKYVFVWWTRGRGVPRASLAYSQIRQTAWQLTSLMVSAYTTPDDAPSWLLPQSLWEWLWADEVRLWDAELVYGSSPGATVFNTVGVTAGGAQPGMSWAPWQEDMIAHVISWAVLMDPSIRRMIDWKIQDLIARTNGTSGWSKWCPEGYYLVSGPDDWSRWYADWSESWYNNQQQARVPGPPDPTAYAASADYSGACRAGLAIATQAGCADAKAPHDELVRNMNSANMRSDSWQRLFAAQP